MAPVGPAAQFPTVQPLTRPGKGHPMAVSRRRVLVAAATVPVLLAARHGVELAAAAIADAVRSARPTATGTSATRCAQCGSPDHTMLAAACPMAPRVLG